VAESAGVLSGGNWLLIQCTRPGVKGAGAEAVLVQWGDRITDPLARLIEMRRNVDDYIE
jgi:hypothetical protein